MGTQQILMIILSVIVVGTAIAVGIQMFDNQLENQTRQSLAAELLQQASQVQAWFRTPTMMGGGGNGKDAAGDAITTQWNDNDVAMYVNRQATNGTYTNLHGRFTLTTELFVTPNVYESEMRIYAISAVDDDITADITFTIGGTSSNAIVHQDPTP